ncbi:MAG: dTDP-4-dehydrorhamnose 3,5-epimerase [Candidatus Eiseniibacteriota bacterium]
MIFTETPLAGAYTIALEPREDERGFFARAFCQNELAAQGLETTIVQANMSYNFKRGTLRGMHYQMPPHAEVKMVRCIAGAIYDVIVDLRPESPTHLEWHGVELSAENRMMLYVPKGFGHGYQALTDHTEVLYMVTEFYTPGAERGMRWDDPAIGIRWPIPNPILSPKDAAHPDYRS